MHTGRMGVATNEPEFMRCRHMLLCSIVVCGPDSIQHQPQTSGYDWPPCEPEWGKINHQGCAACCCV